MDLGAGLLAILTSFLVKGAVMALSAVLLTRVWRAAHAPAPRRLWLLVPESERGDARVLAWALALFAASELTCGVEVYVLTRSNAWVDGVHGLLLPGGALPLVARHSLPPRAPHCPRPRATALVAYWSSVSPSRRAPTAPARQASERAGAARTPPPDCAPCSCQHSPISALDALLVSG